MIDDRFLRPSPACVHSVTSAPAADAWAAHGLACHQVRRDGGDLYAQVATALCAPAWFGGNADALADVLRDLSWLPRQGRVLILPEARTWFRDDPCRAGVLVDCWLEAGAAWAAQGLPFHLLLVVGDQ